MIYNREIIKAFNFDKTFTKNEGRNLRIQLVFNPPAIVLLTNGFRERASHLIIRRRLTRTPLFRLDGITFER